MAGISGVTAFPDGDNLFKWAGSVTGVEGTPYEGLTFKLCLKFPASYPYTAPTVTFESRCFHPNVDDSGNICLDILKVRLPGFFFWFLVLFFFLLILKISFFLSSLQDKWSAVYSVQTVLLSIQSLLGEPNPASPLNSYAASLWANREEYRKVVVEKFKSGSC